MPLHVDHGTWTSVIEVVARKISLRLHYHVASCTTEFGLAMTTGSCFDRQQNKRCEGLCEQSQVLRRFRVSLSVTCESFFASGSARLKGPIVLDSGHRRPVQPQCRQYCIPPQSIRLPVRVLYNVHLSKCTSDRSEARGSHPWTWRRKVFDYYLHTQNSAVCLHPLNPSNSCK